jgi:hypothetical protein
LIHSLSALITKLRLNIIMITYIRLLTAAALFVALSATALAHPQIPGAPQVKPVALTNATIHPVSGPVIEKGTLVFDGGKITALGKDAAPPAGAENIDLAGKHVYPGLFESWNDVGCGAD